MAADKGKVNETNSGPVNGAAAEAEAALFEGVEKPQTLNREALKKKTITQLASMAKPYSSKAFSTLKGYDKDKLIDIIQAKSDKPKPEEPKARATRSKGEFEQLIEFGFAMADKYKMDRDGEPNPIMLKEFVKSQAIMQADEAKAAGKFEQETASKLMFIGGVVGLAITTIGPDRIIKGGKAVYTKYFGKKPENAQK